LDAPSPEYVTSALLFLLSALNSYKIHFKMFKPLPFARASFRSSRWPCLVQGPPVAAQANIDEPPADGWLAILEMKRATFAVEGKVTMPHSKMQTAEVGKRWDWSRIKR
jgi:hypothetical protein